MAEPDVKTIAACGLYCGACGARLKGKCEGCATAPLFASCKVRACCKESGISTCAECEAHPDPASCGKFNNFISKIFGFVFRSDRAACVRRIREAGAEAYAKEMAASGRHTIRRN